MWRVQLTTPAAETIAAALHRAAAVESLPATDPNESDPVRVAAALAEGSPRAAEFTSDVAESVRNLALSRSAAAEAWPEVHGNVFAWVGRMPDPLVFFEQSIVDGHPRHPLRRTRRGMSEAEQAAYAPEYRPIVDLVWQPVPAERFHAVGTWPFHAPDGSPVLPMHPWQHDRITAELPPPLPDRLAAAPLMSLRTFAVPGLPLHLKTAVDVQMTSAVRTVSPAAMANGPVLSRFLGNLPGLTVLGERAAGAVLGEDGPMRSLAAIVRDAPALPDGRVALPLAALTARTPHPRLFAADAVAYAGVGPAEWWARLLSVLLPVPLGLAARGIGLEAHGQNLLLVLAHGLPAGLRYRDFGGVRVHTSVPAPPLAGDLVTADLGEVFRTVLGPLFAVVLTDLAEAFTDVYGIAPAALWRAVHEAVRAIGLSEPLLRALYADTLPVKATTAMRLAADPLEPIWAHVPNPLAVHR